MLVLNGKKIKYGILSIFTMFFILAIILSSKYDSKKYINTVSLPVSGKTVVIDAGHRKTRRRSRSG